MRREQLIVALIVTAVIGLLLMRHDSLLNQIGPALLFLAVVALFITWVAPYVTPYGEPWPAGGIEFAFIALFIDPYTFGSHGSDFRGPTEHPWQQWASGALGMLLVASMVLLWRRKRRRAFVLLALECLVFTLLNVVYISRDGLLVRSVTGFGGSPMPLMATTTALVVRVCILASLARELFPFKDWVPRGLRRLRRVSSVWP